MLAPVKADIARARIRVRGAVQGVGFRPFVYRIALELGLSGFTFNDGEGVVVEAQGPAAALVEMQRRLRDDAPPLARVEFVQFDSLVSDASQTVPPDGPGRYCRFGEALEPLDACMSNI